MLDTNMPIRVQIQVPVRQKLIGFWNLYPLFWNKNISINLMETHHITGLKAKKIISVMELPEADKSIYQLSNADKPQNREIVLFSLMLQELT